MNELTALHGSFRRSPLGDALEPRAIAMAVAILALGLLLAVVPPEMSLLVLLALGLSFVVLLHPAAGLGLLLLVLPFSQTRQLTLAGVRVGAAEILLAFTLCAWLARAATRQEIRLPSAPLTLPFLAFAGVQLLSLLGSVSLREGLPELAKWLEMLLIYLLVASEARPTHVPWLVGAALLAGSAQALLGVYQFVAKVGPEAFTLMGRFVRAYGTFNQPNPYAGYLGLVAPLALSLAMGATAEAWRGLAERPTKRRSQLLRPVVGAIILAGMAGLMVIGMGMSWSRGAWLGLAASTVVVGGVRSRRTTLLLLLLAGFVVAAAVLSGVAPAPNALTERLTDLGDHVRYALGGDVSGIEVTDANFAVLERVAHWQAAWRMFVARPWLGVGIGNYAVAYPSVAVPRWNDPLGHAHNIYLHFLGETGLVGLCAYLVLLSAATVQIWRARRAASPFSRALAIGVLGMLAHLAVHSLVDNLYVQGTYLHVAAMLGLVEVVRRASLRDLSAVPRASVQQVATVGSVPAIDSPDRRCSQAGG